MNRRGFLGALAAIAASPALSKIKPADPGTKIYPWKKAKNVHVPPVEDFFRYGHGDPRMTYCNFDTKSNYDLMKKWTKELNNEIRKDIDMTVAQLWT